MKIPKLFKLFSTTINVEFHNKELNALEAYGDCSTSQSLIRLSSTKGVNELSHDTIVDTFYHEKIHVILDCIGEHKLSSNEKFVDLFSKALRQADESAEFSDDIEFDKDGNIICKTKI